MAGGKRKRDSSHPRAGHFLGMKMGRRKPARCVRSDSRGWGGRVPRTPPLPAGVLNLTQGAAPVTKRLGHQKSSQDLLSAHPPTLGENQTPRYKSGTWGTRPVTQMPMRWFPGCRHIRQVREGCRPPRSYELSSTSPRTSFHLDITS